MSDVRVASAVRWMGHIRRAIGVWLVLAAVGATGAMAKDDDWKATVDWEAVKLRGTGALEQNHFAQALSLYRDALRVQQRAHRAERATLLFNVALTHRKSGRIDLAWQRFAELAVQSDHPGVAQAAIDQMKTLREAHEALPRLTVDCATGIEMQVGTPDGYVLTDGPGGWVPCTEAQSEWSSQVQPGAYAIKVRAGSHSGTFELHMGQADQHHHVYIPSKVGGAMCAGGPRG